MCVLKAPVHLFVESPRCLLDALVLVCAWDTDARRMFNDGVRGGSKERTWMCRQGARIP